ncbi:hypothetical protein BpHYR1_028397 [Brachionus plicatilis]|uniref:Uncharacterized protein n=1 Tax=Brachionus plicatilis TaxID=10195 RepID=A0A3M7PHL7_BRAPC|nr:hypothetical protein BpHYR1_028397 [Brachionus plicatilis]
MNFTAPIFIYFWFFSDLYMLYFEVLQALFKKSKKINFFKNPNPKPQFYLTVSKFKSNQIFLNKQFSFPYVCFRKNYQFYQKLSADYSDVSIFLTPEKLNRNANCFIFTLILFKNAVNLKSFTSTSDLCTLLHSSFKNLSSSFPSMKPLP